MRYMKSNNSITLVIIFLVSLIFDMLFLGVYNFHIHGELGFLGSVRSNPEPESNLNQIFSLFLNMNRTRICNI